MKKSKVFPIAVIILVLLVLPMLAACGPSIPAKAAGPDDVADHESDPNFDYALAADHSAYRWLSTARGYERLGLLNEEMLSAGDVSAYRWLAIARGYERLGLLID